MSKFKAGDRVVCLSDIELGITIGRIYTISNVCGESFLNFLDDDGTQRTRRADRYDLVTPPTPDPALDYLKARITDLRSREGNNRAEIDELCRMLAAVYGLQIVTKLGIEFQPVES